MTYSLKTLQGASGSSAAARASGGRFGHGLALVLGLGALVFWVLALATYSGLDAAWSTSGARPGIRNAAGRVGA